MGNVGTPFALAPGRAGWEEGAGKGGGSLRIVERGRREGGGPFVFLLTGAATPLLLSPSFGMSISAARRLSLRR